MRLRLTAYAADRGEHRQRAAIEDEQIDLAADLREKEERMKGRIAKIESDMGINSDAEVSERPYVTEEDIAEVIGMWTGIPVKRLQGDETTRLLQMEEYLHNRVVGQQEAIVTIAKAVRRALSEGVGPLIPSQKLEGALTRIEARITDLQALQQRIRDFQCAHAAELAGETELDLLASDPRQTVAKFSS